MSNSIIQFNLADVISDRFGRYAKYIIQDRALPDVRDGLKPVQRRILYAMWEDGNTHDKNYRKSVKSVGLVIGNYHPHGENSVYDAMVRMSQAWKVHIPLIDMHGNNGSIDDDPAAAMRYTEARLALISDYLLKDIEKETVAFTYNFDDTTQEPTVLPARFPNLLTSGINGIAAGYATNIPPHNLNETLHACIYRITRPNCSLEEIMQFIKGPDFPTGGIIQGIDGIKSAFETGKGRVVVRGKVDVVQLKTVNQLIITEIPYEVIKSNLVKRIDEIRVSKVIDGILDVRDESDRNGLKIVVDIKKDINSDLILQYLYKHSDLQVYYHYNMVAIVDKRPMQIGLLKMLDAFIKHRQEVVYKASVFELNNAKKRLHIVAGLIRAIDVLDEIIAIIRIAKDKQDSKNKLMEEFGFSDAQAEAIVTLRLYRLSNTDIVKLETELNELELQIEKLSEIIENQTVLNQVVIQQLDEMNQQFVTARKSVIEDEVENITIDKTQLISKEQVMITLSKDGYIKKSSLRSFSASDGKIALKEGDQVVLKHEANTLQKLIFFTNVGTYGYVDVYTIPEMKWKDIGQHLNSIIKMDGNEKIISAFTLTQFNTYGYFISLTKQGMIKKTKISDFEVSRNSKTMTAMSLNDGDEVIKTMVAYDDDEVILATKNGYVARYSLDLITCVSSKSKGMRAMKVEDDEIVCGLVSNHQKNQVVFFNDKMHTKRMKLSEINITGRNVKGDRVFKQSKSNPMYLKNMWLCNVDDVIETQENIEIAVKEIVIMNKTQTFSTQLKILEDTVLIENIVEIAILKQPETLRAEEVAYEIQGLDL